MTKYLSVFVGGMLTIALTGCNATQKVNFANVQQHYTVAKTGYTQGDLHTAEGYLLKVVKAQPNHHESWCLLGHVYYRLNSYQAASNAYQTCLSLRPEQSAIWHNLAAVRLRQATELLIKGMPYLKATTVDKQFSTNYQLLLEELAHFHGVANLNLESRVEN
ncbi:MAG: hypothetical protein B7X54_04795 [Idiomarina sp. 34-48-12]|nr:MAG: hypothetical protein B7X54_04795 [Idiomarina sp. 34-48-12]